MRGGSPWKRLQFGKKRESLPKHGKSMCEGVRPQASCRPSAIESQFLLSPREKVGFHWNVGLGGTG